MYELDRIKISVHELDLFFFRYVVTIELRDTGTYAFALPPEQILPTCKETMDGMLGMFAPTESLREYGPTSSCRAYKALWSKELLLFFYLSSSCYFE